MSEPQRQRVRHAVFSLSSAGIAGTQLSTSTDGNCAAQMLERNWSVVADQGPTTRWHRTRGEKCDCVAAYDMKEKLKKNKKIQKKEKYKKAISILFSKRSTKKTKKTVDLHSRPGRDHRAIFLLYMAVKNSVQQKAAEKCNVFGSFHMTYNRFWSLLCSLVVLCFFMLLCSPLRSFLWSFAGLDWRSEVPIVMHCAR